MEKNSETSNTFTHMVKQFLTKVLRSFNGEKTVFAKTVLGELNIHKPRNEAQFISFTQSCLTLCDPVDFSTQTFLFITNSRSLLKLMSIELVMPSNRLILCWSLSSHLQSFPASGSFQMRQLFTSGGQITGVASSGSVLPPNIQNWLPLRWTRWISLQSKDAQKSSSTPHFKSINSPVLSFLNSPTLKSIYDYWKNHSFD